MRGFTALRANRAYGHASLLGMAEPLTLEAVQGVLHILLHVNCIIYIANFLWERREIKCQDQDESGDLFPILLPPDPIHLRYTVGVKKGKTFILVFRRKVFMVDHSFT